MVSKYDENLNQVQVDGIIEIKLNLNDSLKTLNMKLLLITSILEFEKEVCKLFKKAEIIVYSTTNIQGHKFFKKNDIQDNWFSANRDSVDSKLYFSFTSEEKTDEILKSVEDFNAKTTSSNPLKAIVLDIEKFIN